MMFFKIRDVVSIINYMAFTLVMLISSFFVDNNTITLFLFFIFLSVYTIHNYFFNEEDSNYYLKNALFIVEIIIALAINLFINSFYPLIIYLFLIDDIILNFKKTQWYFYLPMLYLTNMITAYFVFNNDSKVLITYGFASLLSYIVFAFIFFLINYLLLQNKIIEASLKEITVKNMEQEHLYKELSSAYKKVETMTASNERNRIAREIHDTVGHTLTTVIVELEACKMLMDKDLNISKEKLGLAQEQVRKGLNDIRNSVRIIEKGREVVDFYSSIHGLIKECELHSGIVVKSHIDSSIELSDDCKRVIYRCLQEGITNGIKHGNSSAFLFKLSGDERNIYFSLEDNGVGSAIITPGFGLRSMKERVSELGGTMKYYSKQEEGFSLYITLPR